MCVAFSKILVICFKFIRSIGGNYHLLLHKQFGFKKGRSTDYALIELISSIYDSFNQNKCTLGVFTDLSFDTVDHNTLIDKLTLYGIKKNSLK